MPYQLLPGANLLIPVPADVNDLGNNTLDDMNLDFSLPFPAAPRSAAAAAPGPFPTPGDGLAHPTDPMLPHATTSDSDHASDREVPESKQTRGRGRARAPANAKAEPRNATEKRKQQALQEKNRRAQRRFRERQKQRVGLR